MSRDEVVEKRYPDPGVAGNEGAQVSRRERFTARPTKRQRWQVTPSDPFATKDALIPGPLPCSECGKRVQPRSQRAGRILCPNCREGGYLAGAHWRPVRVTAAPIETHAPKPVKLTGRLAHLAAQRPEPETDNRTVVDPRRVLQLVQRLPRQARPKRPLAPIDTTPGSGRRGRPRKYVAPVRHDRSPEQLAALERVQAARQQRERRAEAIETPAGFPPRQYEAWFLTQIEGLSLAAAGVRMGGISKVAVKHLVDKAILRGVNDPADKSPVG